MPAPPRQEAAGKRCWTVLDWPAETRLFEVDTAQMRDFKDSVLAEIDAAPRCRRVPVAADIRADWLVAVRRAGFEPDQPTLWLIEGLFGFLSAAVVEQAPGYIHTASAPGSQVGFERVRPGHFTVPLASRTYDRIGVDLAEIVPPHDDLLLDAWLVEQGWQTDAVGFDELAARAGRPMPRWVDSAVPGSAAHVAPPIRMVEGRLAERRRR